jgi:hypothetical protein
MTEPTHMFPRGVRLVLITFALPLLADAQVLQKPADSNVVRFIEENYHFQWPKDSQEIMQ